MENQVRKTVFCGPLDLDEHLTLAIQGKSHCKGLFLFAPEFNFRDHTLQQCTFVSVRPPMYSQLFIGGLFGIFCSFSLGYTVSPWIILFTNKHETAVLGLE